MSYQHREWASGYDWCHTGYKSCGHALVLFSVDLARDHLRHQTTFSGAIHKPQEVRREARFPPNRGYSALLHERVFRLNLFWMNYLTDFTNSMPPSLVSGGSCRNENLQKLQWHSTGRGAGYLIGRYIAAKWSGIFHEQNDLFSYFPFLLFLIFLFFYLQRWRSSQMWSARSLRSLSHSTLSPPDYQIGVQTCATAVKTAASVSVYVRLWKQAESSQHCEMTIFLFPPGLCATFVPCILACKVAQDNGDSCCVPFLPGAMIALRTSIRSRYRIDVSVLKLSKHG